MQHKNENSLACFNGICRKGLLRFNNDDFSISRTINAEGYGREHFSFSVLLPIFTRQFVW
ncbi:hypothetical protein HMPREF9012_1301 [Bacteroidetes bacterium oral taxon 272 str. F0290]|nr:hypothetical protein HMPREF9012_1301 [Bacteroidetes bacterium oral taxon 272 str. F0290]